MPIKKDVILPAPCWKLIHKSGHEPFADVVVVLISSDALVTVGEIPNDLGKMFDEIGCILLKSIGDIRRPWQEDVVSGPRI